MLDLKKYISNIISIICALDIVGIVKAQSPPYITITASPTITPLATTTFGAGFTNLSQSHFNLIFFPSDVLSAYSFTTMGVLEIPSFLIFFFLFVSMWLSNSNLRLASITGLLFSGAFLFAGGIGVTMPIVLQPIAAGALIASVTGIVMSMFKNIG